MQEKPRGFCSFQAEALRPRLASQVIVFEVRALLAAVWPKDGSKCSYLHAEEGAPERAPECPEPCWRAKGSQWVCDRPVAMAQTLADTFLADLDELSDDDDLIEEEPEAKQSEDKDDEVR